MPEHDSADLSDCHLAILWLAVYITDTVILTEDDTLTASLVYYQIAN